MGKTLRILGIVELVVVTITILCAIGGSEPTTVGFWALSALGLAIAQSIVGIVKSNKS